MSRLVGLACVALLLLPAGRPDGQERMLTHNNRFSKYKAVEAYEFRPEILMLPSYSDDGQVCEIGLEKRHYFPGLINWTSDLPEKEINQMVDELVPANERGPKHGFGDVHRIGRATQVERDYENVSVGLAVDSPQIEDCTNGLMVITIKWKNRKCHEGPPGEH